MRYCRYYIMLKKIYHLRHNDDPYQPHRHRRYAYTFLCITYYNNY